MSYSVAVSEITILVALPRNAMHNADYATARRLSVRPYVCVSHAGIVSKRLNVSSNFFHRR